MLLSSSMIEVMHQHARDAYPDECCGLIVGQPPGDAGMSGQERMRLLPLRNVQNEYHERDPETYTRTARRAYLIDPFEFERILEDARDNNEVLRGIFHSHPDEESYFSQEDKNAAVPFGDIPAFPQAEQIVMSVMKGEVKGARVFVWSSDGKDFLEGELVVDVE